MRKYLYYILGISALMILINLMINFYFDKPICEKMESFYEEFNSEIVLPDASPMSDRFFEKYDEENLSENNNESIRLISKQKSIEGHKTEIVNLELKNTDRRLIATHKVYISKKESPHSDSLYHFSEVPISKTKWLKVQSMIRNSCFWGKSPHHPKEVNVLCDNCCHSILELKDPSKKNFLGRDYHYIARLCGSNDMDHNRIKDAILSLVNQ